MTDPILFVLGVNAAMILGLMLLLWLASIMLRDVSFIDAFWGLGFVVIAGTTWLLTPGGSAERRLLLLALTAIWGVRLGLYLFHRWRRDGPDKRYVALLARAPGSPHWFSLRKVFLLQGALMLVVALPIMLGMIPAEPAAVGPIGWIGAALAIIGIGFETIADAQLAAFRRRGESGVLDSGLWRYTRHPNYFGDCCFWWGMLLIAAETRFGLSAIVGPLLMTFLLVKWSGAALLERRLKRSKPGYEDYVARTSAFFPAPPRPR